MTTPALIALLAIFAGTACLVLSRAAARWPDPEDTGFPSGLSDALTRATAWVSAVPAIGTLAILAGPAPGLAAAAILALALAVPSRGRLIPYYALRTPLAAAAFLCSTVSGFAIITGGFGPAPTTP